MTTMSSLVLPSGHLIFTGGGAEGLTKSLIKIFCRKRFFSTSNLPACYHCSHKIGTPFVSYSYPYNSTSTLEFYQGAIELFLPVLTTGSTKVVHVLSCLCDNACKRSPAICRKSRASSPVSRLMSVPIWLACAKQGH